jgi:hypothetical protein
MKTQSIFQKQKEKLLKRWSEEDYPGGTPRFQLSLLAKDIVVFGLIPISAIIAFKIVEASMTGSSAPNSMRRSEAKIDRNEKHSQIIQFIAGAASSGKSAFSKRAPGTIVRVRLLNVVETFSTSSVHAQVVDVNLGREFLGATLVGDASPEGTTGRIKIDFKFVRHPKRLDLAVPINARAMSLDGTIGVAAKKKEGFFARAAIRSGSSSTASVDTSNDKQDFKTIVARALAAGMMQEFQSEGSVAYNNAQVLTLKPMTEFFVELTDYFPGQK